MACSSENQWLDTALNLAGDNRAELQKVLDRYKEEDGDKYRAACFLIENMPFHGAYEGKALENYRKYFSEYVSFPYSRHVQELIDSLKRADGEFSINQLTYKRDIMTVDSAFLVNHIEWAFKVWREQPWGKLLRTRPRSSVIPEDINSSNSSCACTFPAIPSNPDTR